MPTKDRRHFFKQALRYFLRQTYTDSELIVVDDGEEPVSDLCAGLSRVRYIRVETPTALGAKLNIGIEEARGNIIQKLDDDDYYDPEFLRIAANALTQGKPGNLVCWDCFLVFLAGEKNARFSGHGWAVGATLCFERESWREKPFRNLPRNVDFWFLQDHEGEQTRVCAPEYFMVVRHGVNTWKGERDETEVDTHFRTLPEYRTSLSVLLDAQDALFYRSLEPISNPRTTR